MSVYKRNKTWTAHAKWTDRKGKPQQKAKGGFPTKKAAEKAERELLSQVDSGRLLGGSSPSLADYLVKTWLPKHRQLSSLKASTYETYKMLISVYINPKIGNTRINEIGTVQLENLYMELQNFGRANTRKSGDQTLSAKTVRNIASIIQKALKDAVRTGLIPFNPSDSALKPKMTSTEAEFMTPENLMKYVASIQNHRYGAILQLEALTGMRRGELLGLSWSDVDFKTGKIKIHRTRIRAGNQTIFDTPKSKKSRRTIEIDTFTLKKLQAWKIYQAKERLMLGGTWSDTEDLVVTDPTGKPPSFSAFDRMFKKTLRDAGLEKMKFHSMRHSYVVAALHHGGALKTVSERVGHAEPAITNRIYNHVVEGDDRNLADRTALFILGIPDPQVGVNSAQSS
jgi:integrase